MILRFEWSVPCNQLIDGDSQRPKVNSLVIASSQINLWCKVVISSNYGHHISSASSQKGFLGYSEINQFYLSLFLVVKYILRLDISMTDVMGMEIAENTD